MLEWDYVRHVSEQLGLEVPALLGQEPWVNFLEGRLQPYRTTMLEFAGEAGRCGGITDGLGRWFEEYLIVRFLELFAERLPSLMPPGNDALARSLARAIEEQSSSPLCLSVLCSRFNLHERTIRYHFSNYYQMSPTCYHQCYRLNLLRQRLALSQPRRGEVGRLAAQLGFWHMGRLGQQYRRLFGESPAETLQRRQSLEFKRFWATQQLRQTATDPAPEGRMQASGNGSFSSFSARGPMLYL